MPYIGACGKKGIKEYLRTKQGHLFMTVHDMLFGWLVITKNFDKEWDSTRVYG